MQLENEMFYYQIKMNDAKRANNTSEYRYWAKNYDNARPSTPGGAEPDRTA